MAAIHTFVNTSTINLERSAMIRGGEPLKGCLIAVSSIVSVIEQLQEEDYPSLDPLMSVRIPCGRTGMPLLILHPLYSRVGLLQPMYACM